MIPRFEEIVKNEQKLAAFRIPSSSRKQELARAGKRKREKARESKSKEKKARASKELLLNSNFS